MLRNIASQKWRVYAWDTTTGAAKTGDAANISAHIRIDDGSSAATNDTAPTEASSSNEPGYYDFDLTQAETNGAKLSLAPKSSTSNVAVIACPPVVYTRPQYFSLLGIASDGDLTKVNALDGHTAQTGDSYAIVNHGTNGNAAIKTQVAAIETDTQDIQSRLPAALVNSRMDCTIDGTGMETGAVDNILNRDASASTTNSTLGAIINDWENGGRLDLIVDAILDDTDLIDDGTSGLAKIATDVAAILVDTGTTLDGKLNTIDGIVDDILADTAEIGAAGAGLTNINLPNQTMDIVGNITGNLSGSVGSVSGAVGSVTGNVGGNVTGSVGSLGATAKADVNAEVDAAIETYHLDHLLANTYDPSSKPGAADALLNELVENDGGVARFTANALEEAPSGGGGGFDPTDTVPGESFTYDDAFANMDSPISGVGGAVGPGADLVTYTFTDENDDPIADADVWFKNNTNTVVVAGVLQTNSSGQVELLLDGGETYFAYLQKDGVNPIIGDEFIAVPD